MRGWRHRTSIGRGLSGEDRSHLIATRGGTRRSLTRTQANLMSRRCDTTQVMQALMGRCWTAMRHITRSSVFSAWNRCSKMRV